ncbi:hypothetical protein TSACC_21710 [Terrimicrobium sacchariphilum]|uniref:Uncharacterized protein n=1 Tax=Terrimicrobium sacchariphilum TaxID=690879 RepID=A0A146G8W2_TERSA|nr:hypothetical protein TSACC_21710 [Terrimicrobium sacchariphilum]
MLSTAINSSRDSLGICHVVQRLSVCLSIRLCAGHDIIHSLSVGCSAGLLKLLLLNKKLLALNRKALFFDLIVSLLNGSHRGDKLCLRRIFRSCISPYRHHAIVLSLGNLSKLKAAFKVRGVLLYGESVHIGNGLFIRGRTPDQNQSQPEEKKTLHGRGGTQLCEEKQGWIFPLSPCID